MKKNLDKNSELNTKPGNSEAMSQKYETNMKIQSNNSLPDSLQNIEID